MSKESNTNKSLSKAISLLRGFTPDEPEVRAVDISHKTGMAMTTTHRILVTLTKDGILKQNPVTRKYSVGPILYAIGNLYSETSDVLQCAEEVIRTLNDMTREVITMAIHYRGHAVIVRAQEAKYALTLRSPVGTILPAHSCAIGKALLSEMTDEEIDNLYPEDSLIKRTDKTTATKKELKLQLDKIRQTGVSFDSGGVYEETGGIASVVRDSSGEVVAAIGAAVPIYRMNPAKRELFANLIKLGSSLISYRLGYNVTVNTLRDIEELHSWWRENKLDLAT